MICGMCMRLFDMGQAKRACGSCVGGAWGCFLVKCPHCGYEQPPEPRWVSWLRKRRGKHAN